jgi:hypothetical protein
MKDEDVLFELFAILVMAVLLAYGLAILAVVWFILSAIIGFVQYRRYLSEAREEFDATVQDLGLDLPIDDVLYSIGIQVSDNGGFESAADWMAGTPLGVTEERPD